MRIRFREPLLSSSAEMLGSYLFRSCRLLLVLCALHLSVTFIFFLCSLYMNLLPQVIVQPEGTDGASQRRSGELRIPPQGPLGSNPSPDAEGERTAATSPPACPEESPLLVGPMVIKFNVTVDLQRVAEQNPEVKVGGLYAPKNCVSPHKVAIIIPFRNRHKHLKYWLHYLHPVLQRQQLHYGVYVINQEGGSLFNRAKLFNIGFQEALKDYAYTCFVFSDVDLIPMDDRNAYRCFSQPRHISAFIDKFGFSLPYPQYFGGVSALSKEQYLAINGFPNNYWGWGGEDDDIFKRLIFKGMSISRPNAAIGKCRMIRHSRDKNNEPNPYRFVLISLTKKTMPLDGLNTLRYKVLGIERQPLYTKIKVDVGRPKY
ncbi:PREDICTED: beta-1,4-galactosyltransferase 1-like [Elephantulus edwardii]|uniref:beta-1,4-galactosyltransferase 1-like n=1 Tax=Elephantulus edwardii TaxID=28737 RepID=UPI0003F0B382|nr:PREDICTED: beta-1,4-galactosyltransferase 1-like [Elephantulus edwardii]